MLGGAASPEGVCARGFLLSSRLYSAPVWSPGPCVCGAGLLLRLSGAPLLLRPRRRRAPMGPAAVGVCGAGLLLGAQLRRRGERERCSVRHLCAGEWLPWSRRECIHSPLGGVLCLMIRDALWEAACGRLWLASPVKSTSMISVSSSASGAALIGPSAAWCRRLNLAAWAHMLMFPHIISCCAQHQAAPSSLSKRTKQNVAPWTIRTAMIAPYWPQASAISSLVRSWIPFRWISNCEYSGVGARGGAIDIACAAKGVWRLLSPE